MKRSSLEIMAEILNLCKQPQTKTKIMYMTNLSWRMLQDYLSTLQSKGLVEVHHSLTKYATTPKGIKFIQKWKKLAKLLQLSIVARGPDRVNLDYSRPKRFECVSACVSGPSR